MLDGGVAIAVLPEATRKACSSAHVRTRLENAPERTDVFIECSFSERTLAGLNRLMQERHRLAEFIRLFGEQIVCVGAVGPDSDENQWIRATAGRPRSTSIRTSK
jgi:hypothetical protein